MATTASAPVHLAQIVHQLLDGYGTFSPGGHVCDPKCSHDDLAQTSLVDRLRGLVVPGSTWTDSSGIRTGGLPGSPGPWDPQAGELLDEIERGAVELSRDLRRVLHLRPLKVTVTLTTPNPHYADPMEGPVHESCRHPSCRLIRRDRSPMIGCPREVRVDDLVAGEALRPALLDAVGKLGVLAAIRPDHWLVRGDLVAPGKPEHGHQAGVVEARLRTWHRRALVVTGFESPPVVLRQIANPEHGKHLPGPVCAHCSHESCGTLRLSVMPLWITARCPYCHAKGIHQNPDTGELFCARPSCRDEEGRRHVWSLAALRHLGLVILGDAAA